MYDYWFIGGTPFCVAGIWNGYPNPDYLEDSTIHKYTWRAVMQYMLDNYDWSDYSYNLSDDVVQATFCRSSGLLAGEVVMTLPPAGIPPIMFRAPVMVVQITSPTAKSRLLRLHPLALPLHHL